MLNRSARLAVLAAALFLSACSLSPTQKKWAGFVAGVLIVGAIAAHHDDTPAQPPTRQPQCLPNNPNHPCQ